MRTSKVCIYGHLSLRSFAYMKRNYGRFFIIAIFLLASACTHSAPVAVGNFDYMAPMLYLHGYKPYRERSYATLRFDDEIEVDVMLYGIGEEALAITKPYIVLSFSTNRLYKDGKLELKTEYYFDSNARFLTSNFGTLSFGKAYTSYREYVPENGKFNIRDILNNTPDHKFFVEYNVALEDWYVGYIREVGSCDADYRDQRARSMREKYPQLTFIFDGLHRNGAPMGPYFFGVNMCDSRFTLAVVGVLVLEVLTMGAW
ncbi:hypothetical protein AGMMS49941_05380 [Deferribacterales bacterium]|nr:hypothetical protein AGMMS49941_05380 [Deferribacterales bacterium]